MWSLCTWRPLITGPLSMNFQERISVFRTPPFLAALTQISCNSAVGVKRSVHLYMLFVVPSWFCANNLAISQFRDELRRHCVGYPPAVA